MTATQAFAFPAEESLVALERALYGVLVEKE